MSTPNTEIWFPWQRAIRTFFAAVIVLVPVLNSALGIISDELSKATDLAIPASVFGWLNLGIAVTATIMAILSRVMAIPAVNAWLTKIGVGSAPKAAVSG